MVGVDDQTSLVARVKDGDQIHVTFGTCGGAFFNAGELWVDWNKNEEFEASESLGTWQGEPLPPAVHGFTIQIPDGFSGTTRARVVMEEVCLLSSFPLPS